MKKYVVGQIVYCRKNDLFVKCYKDDRDTFNYKCSLCGSYITNGKHDEFEEKHETKRYSPDM